MIALCVVGSLALGVSVKMGRDAAKFDAREAHAVAANLYAGSFFFTLLALVSAALAWGIA